MSTDAKRRLEIAGLIVSMVVAIASAMAAWIILPYRVQAAESDIRQMKAERATDHDLLQRIDVRTDRMDKALDRLTK